MGRTISLFAVMMAVWLLWSGQYSWLLVGFGLLSCLLVAVIARRMRILDFEGHPVHLARRLPAYCLWLLWAIVRSNLDVARRILHPRLPVSPRIVRVKASQRTDLGKVVFANSITLTPGTLTLEVEGEEIEVHALTRESAADLESGEMDRRVTWVEGEED